MSRDLERLIESLITDISCYGDLGCTVSHVLESLSIFYKDAQERNDEIAQAPQSVLVETNQLLWSTAWDWLRTRKDISVGVNRKWNHLSLSDILAIPDPESQDISAVVPTPSTVPKDKISTSDTGDAEKERSQLFLRMDLPRKRPRMYVSEDRMWESIAGHAPDYRRVPRLEWMALVGIASTKHQGILQGDLGRLVGQDKRSLPKRTDALAEKGYISKRTTLVRGTKTSKMWLTRFAPALPTDPTKAAAGIPTTVDMSRDALARDLEPVPWRGRWIGDSVDYISLAQTIMAVVKAYRIIRYHDLRCKLGILGLRWQMKVAAKTCRFFVQTGAIQYVGATLSGKLFKDCLKFDHDLTHEDWAAYLATGKQKSSSLPSDSLGGIDFYADGAHSSAPVTGSATSPTPSTPRTSNRKRIAIWTADKPLTSTVFDNILAAGSTGLSNKQIGDSTLGSSFRRYLSSISSTLAISTLQPKHLDHFQVVSEMHRKGKSQQYRYFAPRLQEKPGYVPAEESRNEMEAADNQLMPLMPRSATREQSCEGLAPFFSVPVVAPDATLAGLTYLAQGPGKGVGAGFLKRKAEALHSPRASEIRDVGPWRAKRARLSGQTHHEAQGGDSSSRISADLVSVSSPRTSTRRDLRNRLLADAEPISLMVTLKVSPDALLEIMRAETGHAGSERTTEPFEAESVDEASLHASAGPKSETLLAQGTALGREPSRDAAVSHDVAHDQESIIVAQSGLDQDYEMDSPQVLAEHPADNSSVKCGGRRKQKGTQKRGRTGLVKCEKCGGTWKNDVGLKYHLEKSQTACNPNYVPPATSSTAAPDFISRRSTAAKHVVAPRQSKPRQANITTTAAAQNHASSQLRNGSPRGAVSGLEETHGQKDPMFGLGNVNDLVSTGSPAPKGRSMRISRPKWSTISPEISFGARNRPPKQRLLPKSFQETLRPPVSKTKNHIYGLINDEAVSVRDMPAQHAPVQPSFRRSRLDEIPNTSLANRRGKSLASNTEVNETSPSASVIERCSDGQDRSTPNPDKKGLAHGPGTEAGQLLPTAASELSHAEAVRASINADGATAGQVPDLMERILLHILLINGGVFPGGRSVWYAALATWETAFPTEPPPAHQCYKDALAKLAKGKQIIVSTHAFKDSRGMMANYQLLRIPQIEASSSAVIAMKAKIIAAYPKAYTPLAFTPKVGLADEDNYNAQPVFSSRRKLVQGIEVLDAPFYANKAANERPPTPSDGGNQTPRKRKRRMVTKEQIIHAEDEGPDGTRRRDVFRFFMDDDGVARNGRERPGSPGDRNDGFKPTLVFLKPNTYLGQEVSEDVRRALLLSDYSASEPTYPIFVAREAVSSDFTVNFTETNVIVGNNGAWPASNNELFETEDCSLTIRGWMPDSRWFLRQNLPQNLTEMVKSRGRPRSGFPTSNQYSEFAEQVDACFDWELSSEGMRLMLVDSIAPDHIFINLGVEDLPTAWQTFPLQWSSSNQLNPCALFDYRISELATATTDHLWGGDLGRQRRRKRRQKQPGTETKELVVGIDLKIRSLISLPKDTDLRDGPRRSSGLDETNETILIAAFVATRTLLGGADRIIEWGLMMTLFPDMALSAMRRFWSKARKERRTFINQLTERFQVRFISAYESNEFPPINFDNYVDYDWARLIKWTASLIEDSVELPASKGVLEHEYSLAPAWADVDNWRDDYYNFQMSVFNRFEAATSRPATSTIDGSNKFAQESNTDDLVTAMSWLRSLCYTPRDKYAPQDIRKKMASIGGGDEERIQSLLEQAVEALQGQGIITDSKLKALEGRPYRLTETFLPRFMKWTHEHKFLDAARFKSRLDASFRRGEKSRIPYVLKDGEVMAMMNLQSNGRVAVTTVDVPSIPLGFDPGNYESRKYPKSYYNFGLELAPTMAYVYDEDLDVIQKARDNQPPRENQGRAIPLWSDFFGELDKERWSQVLGAVAFVVATRGPLDVSSVCAVLKPYLQEFEVQMVFDWGRHNGVLKGMTYGTSCTVDEWWWLLVGRQRDIAV